MSVSLVFDQPQGQSLIPTEPLYRALTNTEWREYGFAFAGFVENNTYQLRVLPIFLLLKSLKVIGHMNQWDSNIIRTCRAVADVKTWNSSLSSRETGRARIAASANQILESTVPSSSIARTVGFDL